MSSHSSRNGLLALAGLALLAGVSLLAALAFGSVALSAAEVIATLTGGAEATSREIVLGLRLPRALAGFAVGGLLALAGALMQVLLRNPLADPYVLGTSGGAAVGTLGMLLLGAGGLWLPAGAFAGALASILLVFGLAHRAGPWSAQRLLLTGIVVAAGWSAVVAFLLSISPDRQLRGMLFWLIGDLGETAGPGMGLVVLALALAAATALARPLNLLAFGELQARALGVSTIALRRTIYMLASLATAVAVTLAGSVGFVGLVVPHMLRLAGLRDHRLLLPGAALAGGSLLVLADTAARTLCAPTQLPVGVLTALMGVPLFLWLLDRSRPRAPA